MPGPAIQQRCWHHEAREAVCRCPGCGRSYCRECVTEHEARLLCAACLQALERRRPARAGRGRAVSAALALAGVVAAWVVFFALGEALILITTRVEQMSWTAR